MSLLGVHLSFSDLYDLCKSSVADPTAFEDSFRAYLFSNSNLLKFMIPGPDVYAKALEHALPRQFLEENAFARNLLDKVIPGLKARKSQRKVTKKSVKPLPKVEIGQKAPSPLTDRTVKFEVRPKQFVTIKSGNPAVPAKIRTFGVATKKSLNLYLEKKSRDNFSSCKVIGCTVCPAIWKTAVITKCTHPTPCNDLGLGVHFPKSVLMKIHKEMDSEVTYNCKIWANPCITSGGHIVDVEMKTEPGSLASKKRKITCTHNECKTKFSCVYT